MILHPSLPTSNAPEVLAITVAAAAGLAGAGGSGPARQRPIAVACATATSALMIAVMLDSLPTFSGWVSSSAPPTWPATLGGPNRLVDSIGVWLLGCLLAVSLGLTVHLAKRHPDLNQPRSAVGVP